MIDKKSVLEKWEFDGDEKGFRDTSRVILHLDVDAFETQVWIKHKYPELSGVDIPIVVANPDGMIFSVNYAAKAWGIRRSKSSSDHNMEESLEICKAHNTSLKVISTGTRFGKIDSWTPMLESDRILESIQNYRKRLRCPNSMILERASKDEYYMDITKVVHLRACCPRRYQTNNCLRLPPDFHIKKLTEAIKSNKNEKYCGKPVVCLEDAHGKQSGSDLRYKILRMSNENEANYQQDEVRLLHAAVIAQEILHKIWTDTGYIASVGIGPNKLISKVACSFNKPEGIAIMPFSGFDRLGKSTLLLTDLPHFGGSKGTQLINFLTGSTMIEQPTLENIRKLGWISLVKTCRKIRWGEGSSGLMDVVEKCRGIDKSPVVDKVHADNMSTSVPFREPTKPQNESEWLSKLTSLSEDMVERLTYLREKHGRQANRLRISFNLDKEFLVDYIFPKGIQTCQQMRIDQNINSTNIQDFILKFLTKANLIYTPERPSTLDKLILKGESFQLVKKRRDLIRCRTLSNRAIQLVKFSRRISR